MLLQEELCKKKKAILLLTPAVLLLTTYFAFKWLSAAYGVKLGYFMAFMFYWLVWCLVFPLWMVGTRGFTDMFKKSKDPFGKPAWAGRVLLLLPPLLAGSTAFAAKICGASLLIIAGSLGLAVVNATCEEILWRGVYITAFPNNVYLGYLYPSLGFALWHISPQIVHSNRMPGGIYSYLAGALFLGLCYGWVAWKSKSIRWSVYSHILTDFLGLGATVYAVAAAVQL